MNWDTALVVAIVGAVLVLAVRALRRTLRTGATGCGCSDGGCGGGSCSRQTRELVHIETHDQSRAC